jgi:hypothetical protein
MLIVAEILYGVHDNERARNLLRLENVGGNFGPSGFRLARTGVTHLELSLKGKCETRDLQQVAGLFECGMVRPKYIQAISLTSHPPCRTSLHAERNARYFHFKAK